MSWILDKLTGVSAPPLGISGATMGLGVVLDDKGVAFDPSSSRGVFGYDSNDRLSTETRTDLQGVVRVKTITYSATGKPLTESLWIQQVVA